MSVDVSQDIVPDVSMDKPQGVSEASGQSDENKEIPPADEKLDRFKASLQRAANMTPEEFQKQYPTWPPASRGCHKEALQALEEAEAPLEEDSDDAGDVTQEGSTQSESKHKGS